MRRPWWLPGLALLFGCDSPLESLQQHERWKEQGIHDYQFIYTVSCYCGGPHPALITVHNDRVATVKDLLSSFSGGVPTDGYPTIDSLFARIARAKAGGADKVDVSYDETYAFPKSIYIDTYENAADDEVSYAVAGFVTLSPIQQAVLSDRRR